MQDSNIAELTKQAAKNDFLDHLNIIISMGRMPPGSGVFFA